MMSQLIITSAVALTLFFCFKQIEELKRKLREQEKQIEEALRKAAEYEAKLREIENTKVILKVEAKENKEKDLQPSQPLPPPPPRPPPLPQFISSMIFL